MFSKSQSPPGARVQLFTVGITITTTTFLSIKQDGTTNTRVRTGWFLREPGSYDASLPDESPTDGNDTTKEPTGDLLWTKN